MQISPYSFATLRAIMFSFTLLIPLQFNISSKIINETPVSKERDRESKSRTLIIAPHPDDEVLGCARVISENIMRGNQIKIVLMTNGDFLFKPKGNKIFDFDKDGDIDNIDYGYIRQQETITTMNKLGLKPEDIIFLGYPDAFLWGIYNCNYNDIYINLTKDFKFIMALRVKNGNRSPYKNSYHFKIYHGERPVYNRDYIIDDLKGILSDFKPTDIYITHEFDFHMDHRASPLFLRKAIEELRKGGDFAVDHIKVHRYLIHYDLPEKAREEDEYPNPQSQRLTVRDFINNCKRVPWEKTIMGSSPNGSISLDEDFKRIKQGLIDCYQTQVFDDYFPTSCKGEVGYSWLHQFVKDKEEWWDWPIDYSLSFDYYDKWNLWIKLRHWLRCFSTGLKLKIKNISSSMFK